MKNVTGKTVRRLYLTQLIMSVFGLIVIFSADLFMEGRLLTVLASILAIGLYSAIVYDAMWNAGAKDAAKRVRAEDVQLEKITTPFYTALYASAFNIAGAVVYAVLWTVIRADELTEGTAVLAGDAVHLIMNYANGIYIGIQDILFPHPFGGLTAEQIMDWREIYGDPLITGLTAPWFYFLVPVPLFAVSIFAYYLGASEISLSKLLAQFSSNE